METLSDHSDKVFLMPPFFAEVWMLSVCGIQFDLLYNDALGLRQIAFKTVWSE
jgi:hypothetical protein